jgi:hypothetical protein
MKNEVSDSSDEETEEGDHTVYGKQTRAGSAFQRIFFKISSFQLECPGLAPTGEIEVKNPFFEEEFALPVLPTITESVVPKPDKTDIIAASASANSDGVHILMSPDSAISQDK